VEALLAGDGFVRREKDFETGLLGSVKQLAV
jgi:hypothetical protein